MLSRWNLSRQSALVNYSQRWISRNSLLNCNKQVDKSSSTTQKVGKPDAVEDDNNPMSAIGSKFYKPSDFDKFVLVFTKRYKSKEEIPEKITPEQIRQAHTKMRIKVANYMIVIGAVLFIWNIYQGKEAKKRGDTIETLLEKKFDLK